MFTIQPDHWYACEFIADGFEEDKCSYSPIHLRRFVPEKSGKGLFRLLFRHANYPEGVQEKEYRLRMIERAESFLLAKRVDISAPMFLLIYAIDAAWLARHFSMHCREGQEIQDWLDRHI